MIRTDNLLSVNKGEYTRHFYSFSPFVSVCARKNKMPLPMTYESCGNSVVTCTVDIYNT
jgi:hypothetical protein